MPPRAKKPAHERNAANHSHSLGLAAPGRRIPRHKTSLPELNANDQSPTAPSVAANGLLLSRSSSDPPEATHVGIDSASPLCAKPVDGTAGDAVTMGTTQSHPVACRRRTVSGRSENDIEANGADSPVSYSPATSLALDVNASGTANGNVNVKIARKQKSKLAVATTILSACPLWDVIAILIILLQLPPTVISIVHGLFALLTFVPPSATLSLGNLPTFHDLIAVDPAGAPSIQTILFVDALLMLCFVWLAVPAQNIILDLAQAVIAIALGGAAASQGSTTKSIICCLGIISASHILHWKAVRNFGFNLVASSLRWNFPSESSSSRFSPVPDRLHTFPGKARSILGAHILAQGLLKGVRRYISWTKNQSEIQSTIKKSDQEQLASTNATSPRTTSNPPESNPDTTSSNLGDGRPPGLPPVSAGKEKLIGGKKKNKKQATQVRFQQPFWAALASTKVTFAKEYEQSQASLDAQDAQAADSNHLGAIDFANARNRVWIMDIGDTDVCFGVSLLLNPKEGDDDSGLTDMELRRWFVKVNGAAWHSIKSRMVERSVVGEDILERWEARIYGLTPFSPYHCEVLTEAEQVVIYDTSLITQPAPFTETAVAIPTPPQNLQPSSPTTTLRNSIHAAEVETEKIKNNLKGARKQHKSMLERIQSQIDREKSKLSSTGGTDERQRQRAKQLEKSIQKIKSEQDESQTTLQELGDIPTSAKKAYSSAKDTARANQRRVDGQKTTFDQAKKENDKRVASVKSEFDAALHKRARFEARQKEYAAKLVDVNRKAEQAAQAKTALINRRLESAASRRQSVLQWENVISELERTSNEDQNTYATMQQELKMIEEWANLNAQGLANIPGSPDASALFQHSSLSALTSAGIDTNSLPGSRPSSLHVSASSFSPSFVFPQLSGNTSQPNIQPAFSALKTNRRRASSLEAAAIAEHQSINNPSSYHTPFSTSGLAPPPGFGTFSPASSAALLANSTALAPPPHPSAFPSLTSGFGFGSKPTSTVVGAEKEGRRKGSNGSGHSLRGAAGSENGSPTMGNGIVNNAMRNGMVSPPGSAIWEVEGHR